MMSLGVWAGAITMPQLAASKPATPSSAMVGISGADGSLTVELTPSARTRPSRISGSDGTVSENISGVCPATTAVDRGSVAFVGMLRHPAPGPRKNQLGFEVRGRPGAAGAEGQ